MLHAEDRFDADGRAGLVQVEYRVGAAIVCKSALAATCHDVAGFDFCTGQVECVCRAAGGDDVLHLGLHADLALDDVQNSLQALSI